MENKNALVGYVESPKTEIRFSLTLQELDSLKKFVTEGRDGKPGRVYLTLKSGLSKEKKAYNLISVYDPNAPKDGSSHRASGNVYQEQNIPF